MSARGGARGSRPVALLIQPPVYDFALYDLFLKPYGLLRVGARLAASGYDVRFINALDYRDEASVRILGRPKRRSDGTGKLFRHVVPKPGVLAWVPRRYARYGVVPETLNKSIAEVTPDVVLVATGMTYWYPGVREAVRAVRAAHPAAPVLAGGVYASLLPEHCRRVCEVDAVVRGDPWSSLNLELRSRGLPGLSGPSDGGPSGGSVMEQDPVWRDSGVLRLNEGCPYRCDYCASPALHEQFVGGDPHQVFDSMMSMMRTHGTQNFAFYDDALLVDKAAALAPFLERVAASGARPRFYVPNAVHATLIDETVAGSLRAGGFQEVRLGYEGSSDRFRQMYDRKRAAETTEQSVGYLRSAGFPPRAVVLYVLAGMPGQHPDEVEESIRDAAGFGAVLSVAEYSPVPGSALWSESCLLSQFPIGEEPLFHNNSLLPLRSNAFTPEKMEELKQLARTLSPET